MTDFLPFIVLAAVVIVAFIALRTRKPDNSLYKFTAGLALATALILLIPLVAMQFTDEVKWSPFDFFFAGVIIFGTGFTYKLVTRKKDSLVYRAAVGVALAAALLLVWINLAVGIIGTENNPVNLMFFGVLAVGIIGAIIARLEPLGMARAMFATALAQAVVAVAALVAGWGAAGPIWPQDVLGATAMFATAWVGAALLFRKVARQQPRTGHGITAGQL